MNPAQSISSVILLSASPDRLKVAADCGLSPGEAVSAGLFWMTHWSEKDCESALTRGDCGQLVTRSARVLDWLVVDARAALERTVCGKWHKLSDKRLCGLPFLHPNYCSQTIIKSHNNLQSRRAELGIKTAGIRRPVKRSAPVDVIQELVKSYAAGSGMTEKAMIKYLLSTHPEIRAKFHTITGAPA